MKDTWLILRDAASRLLRMTPAVAMLPVTWRTAVE
jgi:hypothetical protein